MVINFAVRLHQPATWLNDRDQFFYPSEKWESDKNFQLNCLVFTLFHNQNRIQAKDGVNHWLPFTEAELGLNEGFASHFMQDYLRCFQEGRVNASDGGVLSSGLFAGLGGEKGEAVPVEMSPEARAVMEAGRQVWLYYHATRQARNKGDLNASLYDIKEYFKGRNERGTVNQKSKDGHFNELMDTLRMRLQALAAVIEPKVYEYGFLK